MVAAPAVALMMTLPPTMTLALTMTAALTLGRALGWLETSPEVMMAAASSRPWWTRPA